VRAELGRIRCPVLLVWGDRDAVFGRAEQEALRDGIPGASLLVYEGTGHTPHWEEPERFARDLAAFVARTPRASHREPPTHAFSV
jgi:pimeloyl-ACP methyl ester carboxylesterase